MAIPRENTMLESKDRKYLRGEINYAQPEGESRRERELTDRVYGALDDFQFLQQKAQGRVWQKLRNPDPTPAVDARDGMAATMAIFFEIHEANGWDFEDTVRRAIEGAYSYGASRRDLQRKVVDNVDLHVETHDTPSPSEVRQRVQRKLRNGESLTDYEIAEAAKAGDLDTLHWLQDYLRERRSKEQSEEWIDHALEDIETLHEDSSDEERD